MKRYIGKKYLIFFTFRKKVEHFNICPLGNCFPHHINNRLVLGFLYEPLKRLVKLAYLIIWTEFCSLSHPQYSCKDNDQPN